LSTQAYAAYSKLRIVNYSSMSDSMFVALVFQHLYLKRLVAFRCAQFGEKRRDDISQRGFLIQA